MMFKDYFYYIFSAIEIGKINIAIVNRWKWVANRKLEAISDKDFIVKMNLDNVKHGLYSPKDDNELSQNELELKMNLLGFKKCNDLENYINNLYPHNYND